MSQEESNTLDFNAIKLKLASPDEIHNWSHGEVTKPETINYRTQKPEKDGLFAEEIFGPSKDWECYCGKYKRIRYKGIVCDKCGVEVTRSIVRRERMGHINLAAPVSHIWFLRGVPSKIGLVLNLSTQELEKVIYFANFIITKINEDLRQESLKQIDQEAQSKKKQLENKFNQLANEIRQKSAGDANKTPATEKTMQDELTTNAKLKDEKIKELEIMVDMAKKELRSLKLLQIISESAYQDLSLKYGHVFEAGIGAEAIQRLLNEVNFNKLTKLLEQEAAKASFNKRRKTIRRLKLVHNLDKNNIRPEWMVLDVLPVIPPDLRPMVQLDGGRFAASDLNDLYRRVINRNNRLKRLIDLNAPEVICRNEKRMLQEAVDALIDNSARHGKTVTASTGQKRMLKSIADILKGKQGRFRQNLLGKRVDYSGRSVIVVGPKLKLNQCGIPKKMALELFKPFVISQLIQREYVHNVRSASRFIESNRPEVWDILEEITKNSHVLLNRAPTLHRLGIQAFQPLLIEGKAIQVHPLVCPAFNADFDGDQMAVHVPLTEKAKWEAKELMLSTKNILKPATGEPVCMPNQDIVLGCFYLTFINKESELNDKALKIYSTVDEAFLTYSLRQIKLQQAIRVRIKDEIITTSVGRIIFNRVLPDGYDYINRTMDKKELRNLTSQVLFEYGSDETVKFLDSLMATSFKYVTISGISWGMNDLPVPEHKYDIITKAEKSIDEIESHFQSGLLTDEERYLKILKTWEKAKEDITVSCRAALDPAGPVYTMIESGSRGSWAQVTQMMGMKGLVTNPAGEIIELPVKGSFKEGFEVLEYFISTHGARKGLSDTALRTANAGYLTRRLIDVSQDIVISEKDCGDTEGLIITKKECEDAGEELHQRVFGRFALADIQNPKTGKVIVKKGEMISKEHAEKMSKCDIKEVLIRSLLSCKTIRGVCQKCYGYDLGYNRLVDTGTAVGIIAAQSIGEPGTQLTMRTFHTGGVASSLDITQGLPRVEELFEARPIKKPAIVSEANGQVYLSKQGKQTIIKLVSEEAVHDTYIVTPDKSGTDKIDIIVKNKASVKRGDVLWTIGTQKIKAKADGTAEVKGNNIIITQPDQKTYEYQIPVGYSPWVKDKDLVNKGDQLCEGNVDLHQLFRLKGKEMTQKYIKKEIAHIYASQGQKLNDKHVEVIVRQMFSRLYIKDAGDTVLLEGEIVTHSEFLEANKKLKAGEKKAIGENLLLGITKASLSTDSFLSAASFQETARVLIDAAVSGKTDNLRGLKENVIIGKLIPAGTGLAK
ncbi:DNA-directed RNA polymerase subunit beta' [Patescibacteria group bacterium]|nr:DNA-directed RNA polymerase subunit beta' [Patescibacteria group bacterium]MBU1890597.1 DNA-directed RNA polymerase subunit beta' [Patescibacteria group bacterium]